jgi:glycerol 2-dehydrogenase (NADP+)
VADSFDWGLVCARRRLVSNFSITNLEKLFASPGFKTVPAVNQIGMFLVQAVSFPFASLFAQANQRPLGTELHPNNPSPKLVEFNKSKGIHTTAYSCLGSTDSPLMKDQTLASIAKRHGKSIQQTLLVWGLQRGTSVIPKSVTEQRIKDNFDLDGFNLTDEEMKQLSSLPDRFKGEWEHRRDSVMRAGRADGFVLACLPACLPFLFVAFNNPVCGDDWLPIRVFDGRDE